MADTAPQVKVPRAKLYKMISYKGKSGGVKKYTPLTAADQVGKMESDIGNGFKALTAGLNSLGASLNSIALSVESMTTSIKTSVGKQIKNTQTIVKVQKEALLEEKTREKNKVKEEARRRKKAERDEAEDSSEKPGLFKKISESFKENTKKAAGGLFSGLLRLAKFFFGAIVAFGVLDWLTKNPEKIQALAKTLFAFGKLVYKITSFLAGSALDGLIKFLENPISIQGFLGAVQFIVSAAPIFIGMAFLKNPIGTIRAFSWVISTLGKSIMGMFKAGKGLGKLRSFSRNKFAKVGMSLGAGFSAAAIVSAGGGTAAESIGAGVGAGAGQAIGATIGAATGIPGAGVLLGAAGAMGGGAIGKSIGPMLEPITKPIGDFFNMVGDVFNAVLAPVQETFKGFFEALGGFMNGILDAVEPHLPIIKKILGTSIQVAFAPLFLGIKALTAVLKFFTPKKDKAEKASAVEAQSKAAGGKVQVPQPKLPEAAGGGSISAGPVSFIATTINEIKGLAKGIRNIMLLPFKAIGYGVVSVIGMIGNTFAAFLPGPLKSIISSALGPIAAIFGIPLSALKEGGTKSLSAEEQGQDLGAQVNPEEELDAKILKAFTDNNGILKLLEGLAKVLAIKSMVGETLGAVGETASNVFGGVKTFLGFSEGGMVPERASGGWISGPMSGYPVSLDGGMSTSFIGHGTEWVGMKGFAGGGAFVVPFDTPATRKNGGLTSLRMREAAAGGYAMPFSMGGALKPTLPKFSVGGKFDPNKFRAETDKQSRGVVVDNKTYYVRYGLDDGTATVKSVSKRVEAGMFGIGEKLTTVQPGSPEFNSVITSEALDTSIKTENRSKSDSRGRNSKLYPLTDIKVHSDAQIAYRHNKSFQTNKAYWVDKGLPEEKANALAARAALELAEVSEDGTATTTATTRGEDNLIVNSEGKTADELTPPATDSEKEKTEEKKKGKKKGKSPLELLEAALTKFGDAMSGKALEDGELNKSETKAKKQAETLEKIESATATAAAGAQEAEPIVTGVASGDDIPIPIVGLDKLDADQFLMPRFGLVNEAANSMVDLN
ncbi:MAG: hypothetical protein ACJZ8Y_10095 [Pirellulaceae bacterium]|tara:strand:+ start:1535 stop:4711 length:3177 start_codon:yes stop_codon:yes gene_type:complete